MEIKKWAAAVLMAPAIASAQIFAAPNEGGGEIVITARPCVVDGRTFEHFREAYAWTPKVAKLKACWTVKDGNVVLVYLDDGQERIYPFNGFKEKK
jgi:hypothetical protein